MTGFLKELRVRKHGCLRDVRCTLTPLHAFIGPNDSGKSTLLRAVESLFSGRYPTPSEVFAQFSDASNLYINDGGTPGVRVTAPGHPQILSLASAVEQGLSAQSVRVGCGNERAQFVRLNADVLRQGSSLIPYGTPLLLSGRGGNLASLYDAVRDRGVERFAAISKRLTELFPTVKALGLRALGQTEKVLMVNLVDGTEVLAEGMSEGLLYYLAFAILAELQRPAIYLVEEPENGLHPSRIADIIGILRQLTVDATDPVQVLMATHSPLVVNELRPDEVTVVTRDLVTGTQLRPINETPHFEERSKVYALGELWLSYADGRAEAPLFDSEGR